MRWCSYCSLCQCLSPLIRSSAPANWYRPCIGVSETPQLCTQQAVKHWSWIYGLQENNSRFNERPSIFRTQGFRLRKIRSVFWTIQMMTFSPIIARISNLSQDQDCTGWQFIIHFRRRSNYALGSPINRHLCVVTRDDLCHHLTARWAELGTLDTAVIRKVGYKKIFADNLLVFIAASCSSRRHHNQ